MPDVDELREAKGIDRYVTLNMPEIAVRRRLFANILRFSARLRAPVLAVLTQSLWLLIGRATAILVPLALVIIATLNSFYNTGDLIDPGWLASLSWHSDFSLQGPPALSGSFFRSHVSPIFWLPSLVSRVVPLPRIEYFALCFAATYALFSAGVYRAWLLGATRDASGVPVAREVPVALAVALLATFSAFGMQALRLPHHELAMPALALWFFIALVECRYGRAVIWFVLCLMVREDAGLHLFAILFLWGALWRLSAGFYRQPWPRARRIWAFAAAGLAYAVLAIYYKSFAIDGDTLFSRLYIGSPPLHHITGELLLDRMRFYLLERTWISLPLLITLGWGLVSRNPLLPVGYIAFLPWLLLNFLSTHITPATLGYYYAFPFWLALAWPLVALHLWPTVGVCPPRRWPYFLVLTASLVGWNFNRVVAYPLEKQFFADYPFAVTSELLHWHRYQDFAEYFAAHERELADAGVDMAVFGLVIEHVDRHNWLADQRLANPPTLLFYFRDGFEWSTRVIPLLRTGFYRRFYKVPGTRIELAAHEPLETLVPGPSPFAPASNPSF